MPYKYTIVGGYLHIYKIIKEEEGTFVCLATNVLGSKTTQATITVNGKGFDNLRFQSIIMCLIEIHSTSQCFPRLRHF
jgi:hypothetical protein